MSTLPSGASKERVAEITLVEITLIVRPEEKAAVERALETVAPPIHTTYTALGRGVQGGLSYRESGVASKLFDRFRATRAVFLPKVVIQIVLPDTHVDRLVEACGAALSLKGGPVDSGLGIAIVSPIGEEVVIGRPRRRKAKKEIEEESEAKNRAESEAENEALSERAIDIGEVVVNGTTGTVTKSSVAKSSVVNGAAR